MRAKPAQIGGANRKYLLEDDQGQVWLFKPQSLLGVLTDIAAAATLANMGLATPVVYARTFRIEGTELTGSLQPMLPASAIARYGLPADLSFAPSIRQQLQAHQVGDWLLANPDAHRRQFLVTHTGEVIAIDKSQSLRFFPHDRLSWDSFAWWTNRCRPVYRALARGAESGHYRLDPEVAIGTAARAAQTISDVTIAEIWTPVVSEWPPSRLFYATLHWSPGDEWINGVISRLARRKNGMITDFETLYAELRQPKTH